MTASKKQYVCSIYENRPEACRKYPWNLGNDIFPDCIFVDATKSPMVIRSEEEQLKINTQEEINEYCVSCGKCCHFGRAACSKLIVID